ncbi:hypothetical protein PAA8504_03798 [Palleronia abyssalis]|uniref:Uncharacterized protein n=2 Tax=Palleronia abyssalis TaxID=1501240 RepID=A0A2R8C0N3_9RHOB|nr:hypothetical protein PAA8504_03798 [Palleronia abyssalis]
MSCRVFRIVLDGDACPRFRRTPRFGKSRGDLCKDESREQPSLLDEGGRFPFSTGTQVVKARHADIAMGSGESIGSAPFVGAGIGVLTPRTDRAAIGRRAADPERSVREAAARSRAIYGFGWTSGLCRRSRFVFCRSTVLARSVARGFTSGTFGWDHDALISATILVYGIGVVTRNVRAFETIDVPLIDPRV